MKKTKVNFIGKIKHFFRHYFVLLLLAAVCALLTVLLVGMC